MPRMCCVPGCRGNYRYEETVSVFRFPKNAELQKKWLKAIARENYTVKNTSVVCERHFNENLIIRIDSVRRDDGSLLEVKRSHPKLHPEAIPHIFTNHPAYCGYVLPRRRRTDPNASCQSAVEKDTAKCRKIEAENNEKSSPSFFISPNVLIQKVLIIPAVDSAETRATANILSFEATENFTDDSSYHLVKQQILRDKLDESVPNSVLEPIVSLVEVKQEPLDYDEHESINRNQILPCITHKKAEPPYIMPVKIKEEPKSEDENVNKNSTDITSLVRCGTVETSHFSPVKTKEPKSNDGGPIIIRAVELMVQKDDDTHPDLNVNSANLCTNVIKQEKLDAVADLKVQGP